MHAISRRAIAAVLAIAAPAPIFAQDLGNWVVVRRDPISRIVSCSAVYKANKNVTLTPTSLVFTPMRIDTVKIVIRIGVAPIIRPVSGMEKKAGAVIVQGIEFQQVLKASRLAVEAVVAGLPVPTGVWQVDVSDLPTVVANLAKACAASPPAAG